MEKKFKETSIPEDFSHALAMQSFLIGPANVYRVATVLFHGVSTCLGSIKSVTIPKAIVFRSIDNAFLAGAKVEFIPNKDDKNNPAAGRWDYVWTCYEEDLKGADIIDVTKNNLVGPFFAASGANLYNMKFAGPDTCIFMMTLMIEMIIAWLKENATEAESAALVLDGVFKGISSVDDGKVVLGIVPDGEMKVLIKDDDKIQEK